MVNNRFSDFKWTDAQVSTSLTRADTLALLDQLSLSLTKRAYTLQDNDGTSAAVIGHIATALQDVRCELYTRMQSEMEAADATNTDVMATYGDAPTTRTTYKPYGGTSYSLKKMGARMLSAAIRKAGW